MVDRQQSIYGWNLPFPRTRWAIIGFVAGVFTWSFAGGGQQHRTDAEGAVGAVDNTFHKLNQGIQDTTASLRNRISDVQNSAHNMNLSARVKDRLSREKSIDDDRIEVEIDDEGTVILNGQVPHSEAKETAVDIARGTEGVQRVEDHLSVPPAARIFAIKTDASDPAARRLR
jgi:osmotically-inducible protein OsmY